jgi:hypothetical protein
MKKLMWGLALLVVGVLMAVPTKAQTTLTANFTFNVTTTNPDTTNANISSWTFNGTVYTSLEDMGSVSWQTQLPSINIPQEFGFENNGFWTTGSTMAWGPVVCVTPTTGCQTMAGGTYFQNGATGNFYDAPGSSMTITVNYKVSEFTGRFGHKYFVPYPTGGEGTVKQVQ